MNITCPTCPYSKVELTISQPGMRTFFCTTCAESFRVYRTQKEAAKLILQGKEGSYAIVLQKLQRNGRDGGNTPARVRRLFLPAASQEGG